MAVWWQGNKIFTIRFGAHRIQALCLLWREKEWWIPLVSAEYGARNEERTVIYVIYYYIYYYVYLALDKFKTFPYEQGAYSIAVLFIYISTEVAFTRRTLVLPVRQEVSAMEVSLECCKSFMLRSRFSQSPQKWSHDSLAGLISIFLCQIPSVTWRRRYYWFLVGSAKTL